MTRVTQRLLPAGLLALALHGAVLSWQLAAPTTTLPTPLPMQRVSVSLGGRRVARLQPSHPKKMATVHKQSPARKTAVLPVNKPRPQPEPEPQRAIPYHEEQSVVSPSPVPQEPSAEEQPDVELAAPSPLVDIADENAQASATARVIQQATPLYHINPPPKYPRQARRRGQEGIVLLEALIDMSGRVAELRLFTSSGHPILDRAARKAVRRWRFTPGTIGGNRHEMWIKVPVRFLLK